MAEAFVQLVLDNLSSLIKEEIGLMMGVDDEMRNLSSTLTTIQAVLEDAEEKQIESKPIRDWLRKLNVLAYEIDDILDECATHVSKVNHAGSKLTRYSLKKILYRHKIARRMKQVTERLDATAAERAKFHLREMPLDRPREIAATTRETGSLLNESDKIYGRKGDTEKIVKMLVDDRIWVCVSDNFEIKTLVMAMIESVTGTGEALDLRFLDSLERRLGELLSQKRYLIVLDDVWNDQQEKWFELRDILSCGSAGASIIVTTRQKKIADIMQTLPAHRLKGLSDEHCWMLLRQRAFGQEEVSPDLEGIGMQIVKKCSGVPLAAKALGGILRFKRSEKDWIYVRDSDIWKLSPEAMILPALRLSYHHLPLELRQCFAYFAAFDKDKMINKEELIRLWIAHGYISDEDVGYERCNELLLRSLLEPGVFQSDVSMHDLVHDLAQSIMENKVPGIQIERNVTSASTIRQVNLQDRCVFFPKCFQQDMDISSIMELTSLRVLNAFGTRIKYLPQSIGNLKHLRYLNFSCTEIHTLPNSLCGLWNLQILNLDYCRRVVALPKNMRYLHNLQHLCLEKCESLSEMPSRIGELIGLKTLSTFVVGLNKGNQLEELQCLNISGRLHIRHLERVKDHMDAMKANIAEKMNLRRLTLSWERKNASKLLLEKLAVEYIIEDEVENVNPVEIQFLALEYLRLTDLPNLKGFSKEQESKKAFPNLRSLCIKGCSSLLLPPLSSLQKLGDLECSSSTLALVSEPDTLTSLVVMIEENMTCFPIEMLRKFSNLRRLKIRRAKEISVTGESLQVLKKLHYLDIHDCDTLTCLPEGLLCHLTALVNLDISKCPELIELPEEVKHLQSLEHIGLDDLAKMACLPEALQHLASLRWLYLTKLPQLDSLPDKLPSLRTLHLEDCAKVASLPALPGLTELYVKGCPELERRCQRRTGEDWHRIAHIRRLQIG
ncbi:hypothetical protein C2S52_023353 [Perilla frutescens var. hirtella]|nr:hypothetical protein C2S52_023353 [Perilla frutescens var. hirtella]